jgi:hypothetical protein
MFTLIIRCDWAKPGAHATSMGMTYPHCGDIVLAAAIARPAVATGPNE